MSTATISVTKRSDCNDFLADKKTALDSADLKQGKKNAHSERTIPENNDW